MNLPRSIVTNCLSFTTNGMRMLFGVNNTDITQIVCRSSSSYVNKWMRRDVKRRALSAEYNNERIRLNAIRKNKVLPKELQEQADLDISQFPRDAFPTRINKRCALTSRPRGVVNRYRISRIKWRLLADYNYLSGVTRASW